MNQRTEREVSRLADAVTNGTATAMMTFVGCFGLSGASAVYVSTPITTGREYLRWRASNRDSTEGGPESDEQHRNEVMATNVSRASAVVARVRSRFDSPVVDPTHLHVDGWKQADYHAFWVNLIERFVSTVVFVDGWEYSSGAALEFLAAYQGQRALLTQEFDDLDPVHALNLIREAIRDFETAAIEAPVLRQVARDLTSLLNLSHAAEV